MFCQEFFDGLKTLKKHTPQASQIWRTRQLLVDRLLEVAKSIDGKAFTTCISIIS